MAKEVGSNLIIFGCDQSRNIIFLTLYPEYNPRVDFVDRWTINSNSKLELINILSTDKGISAYTYFV
jgi:hypothetical protein